MPIFAETFLLFKRRVRVRVTESLREVDDVAEQRVSARVRVPAPWIERGDRVSRARLLHLERAVLWPLAARLARSFREERLGVVRAALDLEQHGDAAVDAGRLQPPAPAHHKFARIARGAVEPGRAVARELALRKGRERGERRALVRERAKRVGVDARPRLPRDAGGAPVPGSLPILLLGGHLCSPLLEV